MEFTECLPLQTIQWLSQLSYSDFVEKCITKKTKSNAKDNETRYTVLQQFCKTNLKTGGITTRIYSYSKNTPAGLGGRLFSGGSLQGLPSTIRGLLMRNIGTDIDMCNAHPVILKYICKLHDICCPNLEYYINHRDECLGKFENREIGKVAYLKATNNDKINRSKELPIEFKKYDTEMKQIQKKLVVLEKYKELFKTIPETKLYNYNGSAINRILCYYENIILQLVIHFINGRGIKIAILMFDGLMIYGDYYKDIELLEDISHYVEKQMPDLNMNWAYKEHNLTLNVPENYTEIKNIDLKVDNQRSFEYIAETFEQNHLKIINKSIYIKHDTNNILFLTQSQLKMSYSHLSYDITKYDKFGKIIGYSTHPFIDKWTGFTHDINRKDDVYLS
jgi:hypothetical protein